MLTYAGSFHANVWIAASSQGRNRSSMLFGGLMTLITGNLDNRLAIVRMWIFLVETATHRLRTTGHAVALIQWPKNGLEI